MLELDCYTENLVEIISIIILQIGTLVCSFRVEYKLLRSV